ncbi:MAG: DNA polymerase III [Spirochaetaceae bacterium]|jgi:DNA polymerase-3 subunit gamma/tau|nr:DNA polymerase III [Spirochaetaceae bacterium]
MFENVIGQSAVASLKRDITGNGLAPSMLFTGPEASGKGTSALELARILTCAESSAPWNCTCSSCLHHKSLSSPDMMILGPRNFSAEIAAAKAAFLQDQSAVSTRFLFFRQIKKLLLRFAPDIMNEDLKVSKLNSMLESINEDIEEFFFMANQTDIDHDAKIKQEEKIIKICAKLEKTALKLEAEGIAENIPVLHVRNVSYWLRLKPQGKKKVLIMENADKMQDAARNSLLKILEEPPESSVIILTTKNPQALIPTILSRLRQYHFVKRTSEAELEVLQRVYKYKVNQDIAKAVTVKKHIDSFMPVSADTVYYASAYFLFSMLSLQTLQAPQKNNNTNIVISAVIDYCKKITSKTDVQETEMNKAHNINTICAAVIKMADKFEVRSTFTAFLSSLCTVLSESLASVTNTGKTISLRQTILTHAENARLAVEIYNQSPSLVLEQLCYNLKSSVQKI